MKGKILLNTGFALVLALILAGCAKPAKMQYSSLDLNSKLAGNEYVQKVDNFIVIFDASQSMRDNLEPDSLTSRMKINQAADILKGLNNTIPGIDATGALRIFGKKNALLYGPEKYAKQSYAAAGKSIGNVDGLSPLGGAIDRASDDISTLAGKTAVILIGDGEELVDNPVAAARNMKKFYKDRLCIYTIHVGQDVKGKKVYQDIADAGGCGFASDADTLESATSMADFTEQVFLEKKKQVMMVSEKDTDGDGVVDSRDRCPGTPAGVAVDRSGCPLDSDGDGVYDYLDKCPDTAKGLRVDSNGCPVMDKVKATIKLHVLFDYDKAFIRPEYHEHLSEAAWFLKKHPDTKAILEGHTDWDGTDAYNQKLSVRRAQSVKKYLVEKFDIDASRLSTIGYGESRPVSSNDTKAGKQKNRRVIAEIYEADAK